MTNEKTMEELMRLINEKMKNRPKIVEMFHNCFNNTIETTIKKLDDGTNFILTGDIPAMWLRDSTCQIRPYLIIAKEDKNISSIILGIIRRQFKNILIDPYANAFNDSDNGHGHKDDITKMNGWIWERKYEIDSLCYPVQLAYLYWKATGETKQFDKLFIQGIEEILKVWKTEQNHEENSKYTFERRNCSITDTLKRNGKGEKVAVTGMTWSGFRPSDDACKYGYLIPSNMFAVVILGYIKEIAENILNSKSLAKKAIDLSNEIHEGIKKYGIYRHKKYGDIYAYETDGMGNYNLMDDANIPSLLSLPYIGYCDMEDKIYKNTRKFILSLDNPYYYEGKTAKGIGSPHTPEDFIWHIALGVQGLTTKDKDEKEKILDMFEKSDGDTGLVHEGFNKNNPQEFTREWFSWANSIFVEFVLDYCGYKIKK